MAKIRAKTTTPIIVALLACLTACSTQKPVSNTERTTITIIGTNDFHGAMVATNGAGGLHIFSGYLTNIRAERAADGGAVLVIDAGDMWQGTLESNLSEGASVVRAYNSLGYTAATIGNHEFDYGPVGPRATPGSETDDGQGALKARAAEAKFPILAANLIDEETDLPVAWPNVSPSIMLEVAGIKVGIVGAITEDVLATTNVANVRGLRIAPLVSSISREALNLRQDGAEIVIVSAHAGSACMDFSDPDDLSSCSLDGEVFRLAQELPLGLVDVIIGGHVHEGIAHNINNISVISSFSRGVAFGRVDIVVTRGHPSAISKTIYPPEYICEFQYSGDSNCSSARHGAPRSMYAGKVITPDTDLEALIRPTLIEALQYKKREIGVLIKEKFARSNTPESPLGNLLTDIMLQVSDDADIAIHNTVGGIRADLPPGALTFGKIYEMFPFDNRLVKLIVSGGELRKLFEIQFQSNHWAAGISGLHLVAKCQGRQLKVSMIRDNGSTVIDQDQLSVVTTDFLASGGDNIFSPIIPLGGFKIDPNSPKFRDGIVTWFEQHESSIRVSDFYRMDDPRFIFPGQLPISCNETH